MGKQSSEEDFTTLYVRSDTSVKVKTLNKLVSKELGVNVKGYDSVAFAVERTIAQLSKKHKI